MTPRQKTIATATALAIAGATGYVALQPSPDLPPLPGTTSPATAVAVVTAPTAWPAKTMRLAATVTLTNCVIPSVVIYEASSNLSTWTEIGRGTNDDWRWSTLPMGRDWTNWSFTFTSASERMIFRAKLP